MAMLNEKLKEIRNIRQITQRELAKMLKVSPSTIAMYETGQRAPDPEMLKRIAEYFNVSLDWLMGRINIIDSVVPSEYSRMHKLTKRDLNQYDDFTKQANAFFMNDEVADVDKEKLFRDMTELFWKSKEINKQKYGRKKKTKSHTE